MNKEILEQLLNDGKTVTDISEEFGVSRQTVYNYIKKFALQKPNYMLKEYCCKHCGETNPDKFGKRRKTLCRQCDQIRYHRKRKQFAVDYLGSKCSKCGYDKCLGALDFHHINPDEKGFNPSQMLGSLSKLKAELDKCILVCSNCHREIHYKSIDSES